MKLKNILLFFVGTLAFIDWFPFVDHNLFILFNNFFTILFLIYLIFGISLVKKSPLIFSIIVIVLYVFLRSLLDSQIPERSFYMGVIVIMLFYQRASFSKSIFNGFLLGGFINIIYILFSYFNLLEVDPIYTGDFINQFADYWLEDSFYKIGLTNKYNKLSYLFSVFLYIALTKYRISSTNKYSLIFVVLFVQLITGGSGGFLCSLSFCIVYFFKTIRFKMIIILLSTFFIFVYSDIIFSILFDFRALQLIDASTNERFSQYYFVIENFANNLWFGSGYNYQNIYRPFDYVHSFPLNNLLMGGIFGFVFSLAVIWYSYKYIFMKLNTLVDKVFFSTLFTFQFFFENFNLMTILGSHLIVWICLFSLVVDEKNSSQMNQLENSINY